MTLNAYPQRRTPVMSLSPVHQREIEQEGKKKKKAQLKHNVGGPFPNSHNLLISVWLTPNP